MNDNIHISKKARRDFAGIIIKSSMSKIHLHLCTRSEVYVVLLELTNFISSISKLTKTVEVANIYTTFTAQDRPQHKLESVQACTNLTHWTVIVDILCQD